MVEESRASIPWARLSAESLAIILSILLAFGIDAWWERHGEGNRELSLLRGLLADFQDSRPELVERVGLARRMVDAQASLAKLLSGSGASAAGVRVPDSLIVATLGAPTYEPSANTLDAALASGEIDLIQSDALRDELANWRRSLADTREDELVARSISIEQVVPVLSHQIDLTNHFALLLPWSSNESGLDWSGYVVLRSSTELAGIMASRLFWARFSADDLTGLLESLDRILELITSALE